MKSVVGRMIGCSVAMALAMLTSAADLNLDGILMIRGMSMKGARVIILNEGEEPRVLTTGLDHFNLHLELNSNYLLSFERPGCVSKQLQFNTSLPSGYPVGDGFYFPFQVTLEPLPEGQHYTYAGPVGAIHFDKDINAFGYDTDYRISKDEVLTKRLELAHTELDRQDLPDMMPVTASAPTMDGAGSITGTGAADNNSPYEVIAPTVSRVAPKVHVLKSPEPRTVAAPTFTEPLEVPLGELRSSKPEPELLAMGPIPPASEVFAPAPPEALRWKHVQADRLHVITTIKVREVDREVEYRRVVSYYGGTTYFRDGLPCSQEIYERGVAH